MYKIQARLPLAFTKLGKEEKINKILFSFLYSFIFPKWNTTLDMHIVLSQHQNLELQTFCIQ